MFKPNRPESMPQPCMQRAPDSCCLRQTKMGLLAQRPNAIDLWRQNLRDLAPAHPDRHRVISDFHTLTHDSCAALASHSQSPACSCDSLRSRWPARDGTSTCRSAPMLGEQKKSHLEVACEGSPWGNVVGTLRRSNLRLTRSKIVSFDAVTAAR